LLAVDLRDRSWCRTCSEHD